MTPKPDSVKTQIDACETTSDKLTGRAGLALVSRYLEATGATAQLAQRFTFLRKGRKGLPLESIFHQILCFFVDGTDLHLTRFDRLRDDPGYAGTIETAEQRMSMALSPGPAEHVLVAPAYRETGGNLARYRYDGHG